MASELLIDEEYASEEDSDFALGGGQAGEESDLDSESEPESNDRRTTTGASSKRKHADADADVGTEDFENSGDEAIIRKGKKRQKKKAKRADDDADAADDDGGEGGLIKTRRQRALEKAERKSHVVTGKATVDVEDLWAKMIAAPLIPSKTETRHEREHQRSGQDGVDPNTDATKNASGKPSDSSAPEMIKIKRTYNFAGKVHTEEKLVARDSAEAKLYLASQDPSTAEIQNGDEQPKRKPRKAFRSVFEPAIEGLAERADLKLGMRIRLELREQQAKAKKLNVVEKSRMDWAGFVDKEGIKDELELAGKSKQSYTSRQDFLRRVEANKEEEARRARIAGRG
ncbi:bucentaur or craniofacial development-domain-containing protein [Xylaria sp. CBS 124048]|nr:bucentaur or craniofacial development-domain-containing protein [Xylaria sp. CBS 124048]